MVPWMWSFTTPMLNPFFHVQSIHEHFTAMAICSLNYYKPEIYHDPEMSSNLYMFYKSKMEFWNILNGCGWVLKFCLWDFL
jgi:hypothetical protein